MQQDNIDPLSDDFDGLTFEVLEEEQTHDGSRESRRGIYLFPNIITTAAILCGFVSITLSASGSFDRAIYAIFLAALLDGMDGRVARWVNAQSAFGEQFDSLSDMLSFGVAPAMLVFYWILAPLGKIGLACAFLFCVCAAFRLARFNVQVGIVSKKYFIGLASPIAAVILASSVWVGLDNPHYLNIHERWIQMAYAALAVMIGFLMISNVRYFSFKEIERKRVPFVLIIPVVFVLLAILYDRPIGLFLVSFIYGCYGVLYTLYLKCKKT